MIIGGIVAIIGAIGLIRMPDFYTRVHAQTVVVVGGVILTLIGMVVQLKSMEQIIKIILIIVIILVTSPTGSHAIARAARKSGLKPWEGGK